MNMVIIDIKISPFDNFSTGINPIPLKKKKTLTMMRRRICYIIPGLG
jgi:hypothetical protein